jgi:hypothetical protein
MKMTTVRKLLWSVTLLLLCFILSSPVNAQGIGGKAGVGGKGGFGGGASTFSPSFSSAGNCAGGGATCTITLSVTAGQFAFCGVGNLFTASGTLSCTDTNGDSLTNQPSGNPFSDTVEFQAGLFEGAMGTTNASETFTCNQSNGSDSVQCAVVVFSGAPTSGWDVPLAGNAQRSLGSGNTTLSSGTTSATTAANEIAVGFFLMFAGTGVQTLSQSSPWVLATTTSSGGARVAMVYQILTTTGTQTAAVLYNNTSAGANSIGIISTIK